MVAELEGDLGKMQGELDRERLTTQQQKRLAEELKTELTEALTTLALERLDNKRLSGRYVVGPPPHHPTTPSPHHPITPSPHHPSSFPYLTHHPSSIISPTTPISPTGLKTYGSGVGMDDAAFWDVASP